MTLTEIFEQIKGEIDRLGVDFQEVIGITICSGAMAPGARIQLRIEEFERVGLVPAETCTGERGEEHLASAPVGIVRFATVRPEGWEAYHKRLRERSQTMRREEG